MENEIRSIAVHVSARILRHLSRGIYRSPAGALKELVSNSYDAGARKVTINTGYPLFEKIVITDNGSGMTEDQFEFIVRNIGFTDKVAGTKFVLEGTQLERVTIGHYGVGILAIGQIASNVRITSKAANSLEGFEAFLDFEQFERKTIDGIGRSEAKDEKEIEDIDGKVDRGKEEQPKFKIGECKIRKLRYGTRDRDKSFTKLELQNIRAAVQQKLSGGFLLAYGDIDRKKGYYPNFAKLLELFRKNEPEIRRGQYPYEKLCWELAVYCPVRYPEFSIFGQDGELVQFRKITEGHDFELVIDGMTLHKPLEGQFFEDPLYPIRRSFVWLDETYAPGKKVSGYLIYKQRIRPKCMQGVLIREAGVAIGSYDLTFLEYPYHEAVKFEQLSGELYAEGLSGALNIDRNSFNETDETYLALVRWFHEKLHKEVFAMLKRRMRLASRASAVKAFAKLCSEYRRRYQKQWRIRWQDTGEQQPLFKKEGGITIVNKAHKEGKRNMQNIERLLLASILVASGFVKPEDMEEVLKGISAVKEAAE